MKETTGEEWRNMTEDTIWGRQGGKELLLNLDYKIVSSQQLALSGLTGWMYRPYIYKEKKKNVSNDKKWIPENPKAYKY